ncbi:hypothetical protein [Amycolatopsis sp. 505]|uniref:hypothetical protein n=2 Tax=unclassified Amycolatopsis TaxID=2618356 RepID=UPI0028747E27|nr:hypothetical protein [Amycolatopsis sp. 505]MDS0139954.1 hypothetical protein [Amycolatopsis sp. 505]
MPAVHGTLDGPSALPYVLPMLTNVLGLGAAIVGATFFCIEDGGSPAVPFSGHDG